MRVANLMLGKRHTPSTLHKGIVFLCAALLAACGGGGGGEGEGSAKDVRFLSKLGIAKGFVITGDVVGNDSKSLKTDCEDENGDPGRMITINGEMFCQAELQANRIYAIDENGIMVRVQYLDEDGNEIGNVDLEPLSVLDLGEGHLLTKFAVSSDFGTASEFLLGRQSDQAVFALSDGPADNFDIPELLNNSWFRPIQARSSDLLLSQDFDSGPRSAQFDTGIRAGLFNRGSLENGEPNESPQRLLRSSSISSTGNGELVAQAVSPASQNVVNFLAYANQNLVVYPADQPSFETPGDSVDSNQELIALDLESGAFNNIGPFLQDEVFSSQFDLAQGLDGQLYFFAAGAFSRSDFENDQEGNFTQTVEYGCKAEIWSLTFSGTSPSVNLADAAEAVLRTDVGEQNQGVERDQEYFSSLSCGSMRSRRSGAAFGQRWVSPGTFTILEIDFSGSSPSVRYVPAPTLQAPTFSGFDLFLAEFLDWYAIAEGDNFLYVETLEAKDTGNVERVQRIAVNAGYTVSTLPLENFQIDGVEPYANESVVVRATDQSNGDTVVLRVDRDNQVAELSRDDNVEFVSFQRVN